MRLLKDRVVLAIKQMSWIINVWEVFAMFQWGTGVPMEEVSRTNAHNSPGEQYQHVNAEQYQHAAHLLPLPLAEVLPSNVLQKTRSSSALAQATANLEAANQVHAMPKLMQLL